MNSKCLAIHKLLLMGVSHGLTILLAIASYLQFRIHVFSLYFFAPGGYRRRSTVAPAEFITAPLSWMAAMRTQWGPPVAKKDISSHPRFFRLHPFFSSPFLRFSSSTVVRYSIRRTYGAPATEWFMSSNPPSPSLSLHFALDLSFFLISSLFSLYILALKKKVYIVNNKRLRPVETKKGSPHIQLVVWFSVRNINGAVYVVGGLGHCPASCPAVSQSLDCTVAAARISFKATAEQTCGEWWTK